MEIQLIALVKQCPFLYDRNNKYYKNLGLRNTKWKEIAKLMNVKVFKAKSRWKSLRDHYRREKKSNREIKWKYFDMMAFLDSDPLMKFSNITNTSVASGDMPSELYDESSMNYSEIGQVKVEEEPVQQNQSILINLEESASQAFSSLTPTMAFFQSLAIQVENEHLSFPRFSSLQTRVLSIVHDEIWKQQARHNI